MQHDQQEQVVNIKRGNARATGMEPDKDEAGIEKQGDDSSLQEVQQVIKLEQTETARQDEEEDEVYSVFTNRMRCYLTYLLGVIMVLSTLTATIYFPLVPLLSRAFSVSVQDINLTITVYATLQAVSPGVFASLADTSGRRPVILGLIGVYACASLGLVLNKHSYAALMALRAVQSLGGSAIPAIAYGIVADVAPVSERGRMLGPMLSTCNGLSAVGPVAAGAAAYSTGGYVWTFVTLLVISAGCFLLTGLTVPETARVVVGNGSVPAKGIWRPWWSLISARKLHKNVRETPQQQASGPALERRKWRPFDALGSLRIIIYPDAAAVLCMISTSYTVYYTFQVAISTIFADIYGYNELYIGLAFLPGLAGMTIGGIIAGKLVDRNFAATAREVDIDTETARATRNNGRSNNLNGFPIEAARYRHILPVIIGQTILVTGYGWAVHFRVHPSVPLIMQFFACAASTLLSHTASALLVDIFPDRSSSAYASGQIARCGLSAASAAVIDPLVKAVGRGWYFTMFSLVVGGCGMASVVISRWKGMEWRQARYKTSEAG